VGNQMDEERLRKRAHVRKYADYTLIVNIRSGRFSGFLWDVSDSGLGAILPLRDNMDFIDSNDPICGSIVNYKLGVKLDYDGHVKWTKPLEIEGVMFLHLGVEFCEPVILPDALYGISFPANPRSPAPTSGRV